MIFVKLASWRGSFALVKTRSKRFIAHCAGRCAFLLMAHGYAAIELSTVVADQTYPGRRRDGQNYLEPAGAQNVGDRGPARTEGLHH
jgi:hypothetical protein